MFRLTRVVLRPVAVNESSVVVLVHRVYRTRPNSFVPTPTSSLYVHGSHPTKVYRAPFRRAHQGLLDGLSRDDSSAIYCLLNTSTRYVPVRCYES
jgi:hypothetical protein